MSESHKYYYLKLKENYFNKEDIKILESLQNGYIYSNILLKLTLLSLKHEGRLRFKQTLPYNEKMLATLTGHDIDNIKMALKIFKDLNLIEILGDGTIYMLEIQELIGLGSTEADRIKRYRNKIKQEKELLEVVDKSVHMYEKRTPELELELELKLDNTLSGCEPDPKMPLQPEVVKNKNVPIPYKTIMDFFNEKCGTSFSHKAKYTQRFIKARWNDGNREQDFYNVIEIKSEQWKGDPKMVGYLRPSTLFRPANFESYKNEARRKKINQMQDDYKNGKCPICGKSGNLHAPDCSRLRWNQNEKNQ